MAGCIINASSWIPQNNYTVSTGFLLDVAEWVLNKYALFSKDETTSLDDPDGEVEDGNL